MNAASARPFQSATGLVISASPPSTPASSSQRPRRRRIAIVVATSEAVIGSSMKISLVASAVSVASAPVAPKATETP